MKILVVDPRCTDGSNLYYYSMGLSHGLSKYADVTLVSAKACTEPENETFRVKKIFYPLSQNIKKGKFRQILRGIEYLFAYIYIWFISCSKKYDVIHIEWPIVYKADKYIFKALKKHCALFSLKAHNVLPHSTDLKYVDIFKEIYSIPDIITVHGENIKKEFGELFPNQVQKVRIHKHGIFMNHDLAYKEDLIDSAVKKMFDSTNRIYLFCGRIDQDKGVDRLVHIWRENLTNSSSLLVIAGAVSQQYHEFVEVEKEISTISNIVYLPGFIEDNLLNYLITKANLIVLPYKKGSMSGVAFTASEFGTPILCTKFGAIEEYIEDGVTGLITENTEESLRKRLLLVENDFTNDDLDSLGKNMQSYFMNNYRWECIGKQLVENIYSDILKI